MFGPALSSPEAYSYAFLPVTSTADKLLYQRELIIMYDCMLIPIHLLMKY